MGHVGSMELVVTASEKCVTELKVVWRGQGVLRAVWGRKKVLSRLPMPPTFSSAPACPPAPRAAAAAGAPAQHCASARARRRRRQPPSAPPAPHGSARRCSPGFGVSGLNPSPRAAVVCAQPGGVEIRGRSGDHREREGDGEGASVSVSMSVSPPSPPHTHSLFPTISPSLPPPPHLSCWLSAASFLASLLLSCSRHTAISQRDSFTSLARTTRSRAICLRARSSTWRGGRRGRGREDRHAVRNKLGHK